MAFLKYWKEDLDLLDADSEIEEAGLDMMESRLSGDNRLFC
jgi:hypothetical protein